MLKKRTVQIIGKGLIAENLQRQGFKAIGIYLKNLFFQSYGIHLVLVFVLGLCLGSCKVPSNNFSTTPQISLISNEVVEVSGPQYIVNLNFSFEDKEGDIGTDESDTSQAPEEYYNIFVEYYEKINGEFTQLTPYYPFAAGDTIRFNGVLPQINPADKTLPTSGEILYQVNMGGGPIQSNTFKFKVWIRDRAGHISNVIETPEMSI